MHEPSPPSPQTTSGRGGEPAARVALCALGLATAAMLTLHAVQSSLDPFQEPVSFYVHGHRGWLLSAALGCFGAAAVAVAFVGRGDPGERRAVTSLVVFGAGMLLTAIVPSDRWFPWEAPPTATGLVHAIAAVFTPPVLLVPMISSTRRGGGWRRLLKIVFVVLYSAGLIGSGVSLVVGFVFDVPPPLIGAAERVLAFGGVGWFSAMAWEPQFGRKSNAPSSFR